jgi:hypothetical protein
MMVGIAACVFAAPSSFAYTLTGTIPGNARNWTAIHLQKPPANGGFLKLTLSAPPANAGTPCAVSFCISLASLPASNPCASTTLAGPYVLTSQPTAVFVTANIYRYDVVSIKTGLAAAVPYTMDVDFMPRAS